MFGLPIWVAVIPPLAAAVAVVGWLAAPRLRRVGAFRGVLIVAVGLTALEAMVGALLLGFLVLFSLSGGMQNF